MIAILKYVYVVVSSIFTLCWFLILTIITGKRVNVSPSIFLNFSEDTSTWDICSDKYQKINNPDNVSLRCKELIIDDFISHLTDDLNFHNPTSLVNYPIFDGIEIIGTRGYYSVIEKSLNNYIKEKKLSEIK